MEQNGNAGRGRQVRRAYDLRERLLNYAVMIIRIVEMLPNTRAGNHVGGQLLRSGTSPSPNHAEAQAAESPADFVHKMSICLKELRESHRWLAIIARVPMVRDVKLVHEALAETDELIRIFVTSIETAARRQTARLRSSR